MKTEFFSIIFTRAFQSARDALSGVQHLKPMRGGKFRVSSLIWNDSASFVHALGRPYQGTPETKSFICVIPANQNGLIV